MSTNHTPTRDDPGRDQTIWKTWDDQIRAAQITRLVLERLADECDRLERIVYFDDPLDRDELKNQVDKVTLICFLALEELPPI